MTPGDAGATVDDLSAPIRSIVLDVSERAMATGARAVVLTGSQIGAQPPSTSDIDVYAIGAGPRYRLEINGGRLVSLSWREPAELRVAFGDPGSVGALVPGWRRALIVVDPDGVAAEIRHLAQQWDWSSIGDALLGEWVAEEVAGYAEEVHKLVGARRAGDLVSVAAQRSVLALGLAPRMTVYLRMLYESENGLWDRVAGRMGPAWADAQRAALGLDGADPAASLDGALTLYRLAVTAVCSLMDDRQRGVSRAALALAGQPLSE